MKREILRFPSIREIDMYTSGTGRAGLKFRMFRNVLKERDKTGI